MERRETETVHSRAGRRQGRPSRRGSKESRETSSDEIQQTYPAHVIREQGLKSRREGARGETPPWRWEAGRGQWSGRAWQKVEGI